ncbi:protein LURP-one-related 10-like isoform X2 [Rutidosis leptorrhynchoides]|uniref:protein LURP-one-related 10-like isoform X2 n=1 Tax=Rutidosis leptorrhynchoides TaxID=125765 RepID=UPI003A99E935
MAQGNDSHVFVPVSVIGTQFIAPYPLEVKIEKNSQGNFVISDINSKTILKVKPCDTSFHRQRLLLDANDIPLVMMREKVYRGESKAKEDMIFSTKTEHMIHFKTRLNVYLANKMSNKDDFDFKIEGNWSDRSCDIYIGDSSTAIAQVNKVQPLHNVKLPKDNFMVTIYRNVDYAFVVALIVIVDSMKSSDPKEVGAGFGGGPALFPF